MMTTMGDSMAQQQQKLQEPQDSPHEIVSSPKPTKPPMADQSSTLAHSSSSSFSSSYGLLGTVNCASGGRIDGKQEMGFVSGSEENQERLDSVVSEGTGDILARTAQKEVSESDVEEKQPVAVKGAGEMGSLSVAGSQDLVEKKKKLLAQDGVATEVSGKRSCLEMHNGGGKMVYDRPLKCSLKIQVIDETALLESVSVPKAGNGSAKEMGFVGSAKETLRKGLGSAKQELDAKKTKQSWVKKKGVKKVFDASTRHKNSTHMAKGQRRCLKNRGQAKKVYSREEMEALRFVQIVEQRKMWKEIYNGLGASVAREYDDLASVRHQKQVFNFDPRQRIGKNTAPGILGVAARGRGYHMNIFVH